MNDSVIWQAKNSRHLAASVAWVRRRLRHLTSDGPEHFQENDEVRSGPVEPSRASDAPALPTLARRLGLSEFERNVLLLAAAFELDTGVAELCARAQHNDQLAFPTFALALALFDDPEWAALGPSRPLRYWPLITVERAQGRPMTLSPLRIDEHILHYLKGLDDVDAGLLEYARPLEEADRLPCSATQKAAATRIAGAIRGQSSPPLVELLGTDHSSKVLVAAETAGRLGLTLYRFDAQALPADAEAVNAVTRRWRLDAALLRIALFIDARAESLTGRRYASAPVHWLLEERGAICFLGAAEPWSGLDRSVFRMDISTPTRTERAEFWNAVVGAEHESTAKILAGQFELDTSTIARLGRTTLTSEQHGQPTGDGRHPAHQALWDVCRAATRPRTDGLIERIEPRVGWDDLVLPDEQMVLLRRIAAGTVHRARIFDEWGFGRRMSRGTGLSVLFNGDSGTGKTMAAEVLANALRLDLYRIDLSAVVSKYIGETETNLRRVFDATERGGAILFIDEADALFGKRSEVRDSHDRYANIEVNYLLQRMESYRGLAILATNRQGALDKAFMRRLRHIVHFPFPGHAERRRLWEQAFPEDTPTQDLDLDFLVRFNVTGGVIHNIALNAAFAAAGDRHPVKMAHILEAARLELDKLDIPYNEAQLERRTMKSNGVSP